jgi:hypothetical protein
MQVCRSSRGAAFDDFDNDGFVDAVIQNSRKMPTVLANETEGGHWLEICLRGVQANRDAVGAWVQVFAGELTQVAEVHSGRGYQSHFGSRLHFGLGQRSSVDRIEIRWPSGIRDDVRHISANQWIRVIEGGKCVSMPHP